MVIDTSHISSVRIKRGPVYIECIGQLDSNSQMHRRRKKEGKKIQFPPLSEKINPPISIAHASLLQDKL